MQRTTDILYWVMIRKPTVLCCNTHIICVDRYPIFAVMRMTAWEKQSPSCTSEQCVDGPPSFALPGSWSSYRTNPQPHIKSIFLRGNNEIYSRL